MLTVIQQQGAALGLVPPDLFRRVGPTALVPIGFVPLMCYSDEYSLIDMACTIDYDYTD